MRKITIGFQISCENIDNLHLVPLVTIVYHWVPFGTIGYHLVTSCTIQYHWESFGTIGYHWVPSDTIGYHWLPSGSIGYHWVPSGTKWYHSETRRNPFDRFWRLYISRDRLTDWVTDWVSDEARPWDAYSSKKFVDLFTQYFKSFLSCRATSSFKKMTATAVYGRAESQNL